MSAAIRTVLGLLAVAFFLTVWVCTVTGCASLGVSSRPAGMETFVASPSRCATLDDRSTYAGGVAAGAAIIGGSSGLATVATEDHTAKVSLAISSLVLGAVAAGAEYVSHDSAKTFVNEGCGK